MTLGEFLLALATDPDLLARYIADPESVLASSGVTGAKADLLRAGTLRELRVKVEAEFDIDGESATIYYVTIHFPWP